MGQEIKDSSVGGARRVLVVDNAPYARSHLRELLQDHGYRVVSEASNSTEAAAMYRRDSPDIVTLDLFLDTEHGFQVVEKLRQIDPRAKIIIVSAIVDRNMMEKASLLGVSGYVNKPVQWKDLGPALIRALASGG